MKNMKTTPQITKMIAAGMVAGLALTLAAPIQVYSAVMREAEDGSMPSVRM
jgi:hypothetical protein